jgi:hypothetical protein
MSATITGKAVNLTVLDVAPATGYAGVPTLSAGEGAPARVKMIEDMFAFPSTNMDAGSWFKLLRFPSTAKVKKLRIWTDGIIDNTVTTAVQILSFGVMFSDSTIDGTPTGVRGLVPNASGLGTTVTVPTSTGFNDVFGTLIAQPTAQAAILIEDLLTNQSPSTKAFAGLTNYGTPTVSGAPTVLTAMETPLINLLGFQSSTGVPWAAAGYFDLYCKVITAATTQHGANIFAQLTYAE